MVVVVVVGVLDGSGRRENRPLAVVHWWRGVVKIDVFPSVSASMCVRVVMSVFHWWRAGVKVCGSAPLHSQRGWGHAGNRVRGDKAPNER